MITLLQSKEIYKYLNTTHWSVAKSQKSTRITVYSKQRRGYEMLYFKQS